ncbi:NAD-dependent epimerase/dehydratase family protein [Pseudoduganella violaceinigra]|uniref:NAD-dependent epimerase/dehydratase family protein n=1 Tax=Pseudoduganella violaceinigra TaxID=246602 RepID=UPI00041F5DBA|nr:NAD(P)-dependent oxidoreductase [Pseudoduganella violaceinigra]
MNILVTGGTGFLGRHTVWRLAERGHRVLFTGRNAREAAAVKSLGRHDVDFVAIDHGSAAAHATLAACCRGMDAVVHCAALASPWGRRQGFERSNVEAVNEVLAACRTRDVPKLVHISSPSIYFEFADRLQVREESPLPAPVNDYARTKRAAEALILDAALPHSIILRPRAIFGPWDNALLPRLLRLIRLGRVPLLRGGRALVDMTYVDNVVDAIEAALALPANPVGIEPVFNVSNGEPIEIGDLLARIAAAFDVPFNAAPRPYFAADLAARLLEAVARLAPDWEPPFTRYSLGAIAFSQTLDLSRAASHLSYRPRVSLDEGIRRTGQWWRETMENTPR